MPGRLEGRTVVVTRPTGWPDALSERLLEMGACVRELPAIDLAPPRDLSPLEEALRTLEQFDWVVFASAAAVERVVARMDDLGIPRQRLSARSLAAVGPNTAARLAAAVRAPDLVPDEATGEALARALGPAVEGRRVLVPRPAEGRPELPEGLAACGADVHAVVAYCTVPAPAARLAPLRGWIERREVDALAFASPSAVRAVVAALGPAAPLLGEVLLAAIGPTTAEALDEAGLSTGVTARHHTGWGLAEAIAGRLGPG